MLRIGPELMQKFEAVALRRFEEEMIAHARDFSPDRALELGEAGLREAVRDAIRRAEGYGFTQRGSIRLFLEATLLYGRAFDADPAYADVAEPLRAAGDPMERAERMYLAMRDRHTLEPPEGATEQEPR